MVFVRGVRPGERKRAWEELRTKYLTAIDDQFRARPDLRGKIFHRKDDPEGRLHTAMVFSRTLLDYAGGVWDLERDWEAEE